MSNGSNTGWIFAPQSAYEVPADNASTWNKLRFNGGGLTRSTTTEEDPEIGGPSGSVTSEGPATGDYDMSLWYGQADAFLEAMFGGTWTGDVLVPGALLRYFTFEESQPDLLSGDTFVSYPNTVPTAYNLGFVTPNSRVTAGFSFSASNGLPGALSLNDGGAAVVVNTEPVMRTGGLMTNLTIDSTPVATLGIRVSNLALSATRETEDEPQVDVEGRGAISFGDFAHEISMTCYDEDRTVFNTLFSNVSRDIGWSIRDANGKGYDFLLTQVAPNGGEISPPAKDTARTQTLPFSGSNMQITRIP